MARLAELITEAVQLDDTDHSQVLKLRVALRDDTNGRG
jgi:hypothetical protein